MQAPPAFERHRRVAVGGTRQAARDRGDGVRVPPAAGGFLQRGPEVRRAGCRQARKVDGAPGALERLDHPAVAGEVPRPGPLGQCPACFYTSRAPSSCFRTSFAGLPKSTVATVNRWPPVQKLSRIDFPTDACSSTPSAESESASAGFS